MTHLSLNENTALDLIFLLLLNLALIFALRIVAPQINLIDNPGGRKTHAHPTPLVGGIAVYFTLLTAVVLNNDWNTDFGMIIFWSGAIVLIGCLDDIKNVRWLIRLSVQIVASFGVVLATGIKVTYLGTYPFIGPVELGIASSAFTIFAVVGLTNAFNLIDGIDGLCSNLLFMPISAIMILSFWLSGEVSFYLVLIMALLAIFFVFNMNKNPKQKIFMGDAGSAGLGFVTAFLAITFIENNHTTINPPLALWLFMIPILDTISAISTRLIRRKSIFKPTDDHIHHTLLKVTNSSIGTLVILNSMSVLLLITGIILNLYHDLNTLIVAVLIVLSMIFLSNYLKSKVEDLRAK